MTLISLGIAENSTNSGDFRRGNTPNREFITEMCEKHLASGRGRCPRRKPSLDFDTTRLTVFRKGNMRSTFRLRLTGARLRSEVADQSGYLQRVMSTNGHPVLSVRREGWQEAQRHKWIESKNAGYDLGDSALKDWFRKHWLPFCRVKRLEHVEGQQRWEEFAEDEFAQILELILDGDLLLDRILDRMEHGSDNLEIINWALDWAVPMEKVIDLLLMIDINRARLEPLMEG
jgi:hypothetical protein